jgi:mannose/fructose/N-acetylgalactosamine-specific phosphotransferase system component IIB
MTKVIHEPQLDTILMVEQAIKEAKSYPTKKSLLQSLPRQVQYQTFNRILDYLESSNKIAYDKNRIIWVFPDNPKLKKLIETSIQFR